jgi:hypothetical protein
MSVEPGARNPMDKVVALYLLYECLIQNEVPPVSSTKNPAAEQPNIVKKF